MKRLLLVSALLLIAADATAADVRVLFSHQSVGRHVVAEPGHFSGTLAASQDIRGEFNSNIKFWDHDYYNYTYGALMDADGDLYASNGFGAHRGSNNAGGDVYLSHLVGAAFKATPDDDNARAFRDSCSSRFDIVIIKPGYRDMHMNDISDLDTYKAMLNTASDWWHDNNPGKYFVISSSSSLRHPTEVSGSVPGSYTSAGWTNNAAGIAAAEAAAAEYHELDTWLEDTWADRHPENKYFPMWRLCVEATGAADEQYFTKDAYKASDHHLNTAGSDVMQAALVDFIHDLAGVSVSDVTGDLEHNNSVTIAGFNFGTKPTAAPIKWETFDNGGNAGTLLETSQSEWESLHDNDGALYSSTTAHSGALSVYNDPSVHHEFDTNHLTFPTTDKVFLTYWYMLANGDAGDYAILKLCRITSSPDAGGGGHYNEAGVHILSNQQPSGSSGYMDYDPGDGYQGPQAYVSYDVDTWTRYDMYAELSTPGVANGSFWMRNVTNGDYENLGAIMNRNAGETFLFDSILLGLMAANDSGSFQIYIDDVYVDNTLARVEIGNASTYASCTHREIQIPSAWSATSVTITVNTGSFEDDDSAYLFVINEDGDVSAGHAVTIGSGSSGALTGCGVLTATRE